METTGLLCQLHRYNPNLAPNVICRYPVRQGRNSGEKVILSAHYDSIAENPDRAPGADDNASGVSLLFGVAHAIHRSTISFQRDVELCFFSGEEQGLLGSLAYTGEQPRAKFVPLSFLQQTRRPVEARQSDCVAGYSV